MFLSPLLIGKPGILNKNLFTRELGQREAQPLSAGMCLDLYSCLKRTRLPVAVMKMDVVVEDENVSEHGLFKHPTPRQKHRLSEYEAAHCVALDMLAAEICTPEF